MDNTFKVKKGYQHDPVKGAEALKPIGYDSSSAIGRHNN